MANKIYISLVTILMLLASSSVFAAGMVEKPVTRIDFNKMINEVGSEKARVEDKLNDRLDQAPATAGITRSKDRSKVIDFVDVEVGVGKERPVVDRRFNSVGETVVVDLGS